MISEKVDAIMRLAVLTLLKEPAATAEVQAAVATAQELGVTNSELLRCCAYIESGNGQGLSGPALRLLLDILEDKYCTPCE